MCDVQFGSTMGSKRNNIFCLLLCVLSHLGHNNKTVQAERLINHRNLSPIVLETVKVKVKVLAGSVPGEGELPGS